jgi:hypothetical protein
MKRPIFTFILFFVIVTNINASVNTSLTFVSNTHNSPSLGEGTLIMNVEAISTAGDVDINSFQDAIQLDGNLTTQVQSVVFSAENFPSASYNTFEDYTSGKISYIYTFDSGTRGTISGSSSTIIVTITIVYNMTDAQSTVSWYSGGPNFFVTDNNDQDITGIENSIPAGLTNFALPVELNSFDAKTKGSNVELLWQTQTEVNNYGFEVERRGQESEVRSQKSEWEKIGFVTGNGNSNSPKDYSFTDKNLTGGTKFSYRLKQVDNDGTYSYSGEVEVEVIPDRYELYQNYPNPFNPITNIKFSLPEAAKVKVDVFNIIGEKVRTLIEQNVEAGFHSITFNAENLSSGTYIYRLQTENFTQIKKMILMK